MRITLVGATDLPELLPLVRAYCDFYQVTPSDQELLELSRALLADPEREGLQLLARDDAGTAVGFATLYWTWQTLAAARVGVMNDLFVAAQARGLGVAEGSSPRVWSAAASTARPGWSGRRPETTTARRPSMRGSGPPAMIGGWTTTCRSSPPDLARHRAFIPQTGTVRHCDLPFFGKDKQGRCAWRLWSHRPRGAWTPANRDRTILA
jgi:GNAT superfamily N-acetyltransferase